MSAASTPALPRSRYSTDRRVPGSRPTLFLPILIFLSGAGLLAFYQVVSMEDQLDQITQAVDKMEPKIKRAQYERAKFFFIARRVLLLAPTDTNANQVATFYKLRELQAAQPDLFNSDAPVAMVVTNPTPMPPISITNSAPTAPGSPAEAPVALPGPASR